MAKYLVPWSGGFDSTYLIQKLLEQGHEVDAIYFKLLNNPVKSEMELLAISKLAHKFESFKNRFKYLGVGSEIHLSNMEYSFEHVSLTQPIAWLFGLVYHAKPSYDFVAISYIMNDCAISWLEDLKSVWKSYSGFVMGGTLPELIFPLIKTHKSNILNSLSNELIEQCVTCENPIKKNDFAEYFEYCGWCETCKKLVALGFYKEREILPIEVKHGETDCIDKTIDCCSG